MLRMKIENEEDTKLLMFYNYYRVERNNNI